MSLNCFVVRFVEITLQDDDNVRLVFKNRYLQLVNLCRKTTIRVVKVQDHQVPVYDSDVPVLNVHPFIMLSFREEAAHVSP